MNDLQAFIPLSSSTWNGINSTLELFFIVIGGNQHTKRFCMLLEVLSSNFRSNYKAAFTRRCKSSISTASIQYQMFILNINVMNISIHCCFQLFLMRWRQNRTFISRLYIVHVCNKIAAIYFELVCLQWKEQFED